MKINILKLFRRKILLVLSSLIVLTASIFAVPKAYSYYQASQLEHQADILLTQSQYQEALKKYKESQNKWDDVEINEKIEKVEVFLESEENYQEGLEAFDNKEYEKAIDAFLKVDSEYKDYDKARNFLEEARENLDKVKTKGTVKDEQIQTKQQSSPHSTPAPTPINVPTSALETQDTSGLSEGQIIALEQIKKSLERINASMTHQQKIMNTERNPYCMELYPNDLDAAQSCERARQEKYFFAEKEFLRLRAEGEALRSDFLRIIGQK